jgi:hypothetical protein
MLMPAISGVSSANLAALNRVLVQVGKGMDPDSPAAQKLDDTEAQKVIGELNNLDPAAKAEVTSALASLMRDEFIQVTDTGRAAFADAMGVNVAALTPKQTAELAGLTSARTAFAASMQALSKTPQMKGPRMKAIVQGLKEFVPPEGQKFMAAILNQASADGILKMDTNARKEFRKFVGGLDKAGDSKEARDASDAKRGDGAAAAEAAPAQAGEAAAEHPVTVASAKEGLSASRADHGVTAFQRALAKGGFFEDILAAFMFDLIQEIQGEVLDKAGEFDRDKAIREDSDRQAQQAQGQGQSMADLIKRETKKDNPGVSDKEVEARVDEAQKALEAVVNSVGAHKNDDGKIDPEEAVRIANKLGELKEPVNHLVADAMLKAIGHTDMYIGAAAVKPIVDWAVKTITEATGKEPDLSEIVNNPQVAKGGDDDPVIQGLAQSDRLENKIAAFMLGAFVGDKVAVGDKVKQLRKAKAEWGDAARHCDKLMKGAEGAASPAADAQGAAAQMEAAGGAGGPPTGVDTAQRAGAPEPAPQQAQAQQAQAQQAKAQQPTAKQAHEMKTQSRQELMEELKTLQQELQQALQALSNILNMMHQNAMNSIRSIR